MRLPEADVVVVGSGAAGGVVAEYLSRHGIGVVCLEQGRWLTTGDYPSIGIDYEAEARRPRFSFSPNERKAPEDYPVSAGGQDPPEIEMVNAVGGTTIHWNCEVMRLHSSDFRQGGQGSARRWPLSYDELRPHYDAHDAQLGVSGIADDPLAPSRPLHRLPPLPLGSVGQVAGRAFNQLGWHWWPTDLAILSQPHEGRPACNLHGRGWYGCGIRAKATTMVTHWPRAIRQGAVLRTQARVCRIIVGGDGRAEGVLYFDAAHRLLRQTAKVVVICCNGIGTPRLLLNSASAAYPDGLANSSGLLGRGCMLHVWRRLRGTVSECIDNYRRPIYNPIFSDHFRASDPTRGFDGGFALLVRGLNGPLSTATRQNVPWGTEHHRVLRREFPHVVTVSALGEDLPEAHNRVTLDRDTRDSDGIPAARVEYSLSANSVRLLDFAAARARELLEKMGAREIQDAGTTPGTSHFMGTARMGDDPRTSVVDRWNRSHDVPNLFIVDGSCFVSSGAAGPTATIGALAHRCACYLVRHRRNWR